jgi:hypothetical protein
MKVTQLKRRVKVTNVVYATGDYTLTTDVAHYLAVGDTFSFIDPVNASAQINVTTITGTTGTTIKFTNADPNIKFPDLFRENYGTGFANASDTFTFNMDRQDGLIHIVSNGTATATVRVDGSIDGVHWVQITAATGITAGSQLESVVNKPYAYGRLFFTVASASAGGGLNTIKAYKAGC